MLRYVSFQGERGAFSEAAIYEFFQSRDIKTSPCQNFREVLEETLSGKTSHCVLPVENSLEGSVGESYDLLYSSPLNAVGEIYYKIEHCLIGTGALEEIRSIYSHPQALGQCRELIEEKKWKPIPTYDTAGSVKIVKEMCSKKVACIASRRASEIYDLPVIKESIQDHSSNHTRFLILSKWPDKEEKKDLQHQEKKKKTSLMFSIQNKPGALYRILREFNSKGVNLTKIESRPKKTSLGEYHFFLDFEGDKDNPGISEMLEKIKKDTSFMKVLGSYSLMK